ncbi:LacI family DNA-binding transcriptional regulator [Brevibacterium marinum]|uniref:DNA-binding LacI/PurR family transcriptional regulator n=1 Tax=Brevibacterium marinum TaxID=418643 RepID=A0A846RUK9_9MICO|nr:LacI family DNA-binding transcriptional regulator [Brevibacterium marinum]NJC55155.1 DNA-binding LacI/PurR family transcriptional regulator [Brevibacterium marinum]
MGESERPSRATIADVAREAGVSRTTVSHALNGLGKVNSATRDKVKSVATRLNYRPSVRAQGLRSGRSQALALLSSMPSAVSAGPSQLGFFTELAMGCARTALLKGYVFVLAPPEGDINPVDRLDIDGAIVLEPTADDPIAAALSDRGIPFVTIDGPAGERSVDLHHAATAELLVGHLLDSGAKQPALVAGASVRGSQAAARAAYLAAAERESFAPIIAEADESEGEDAGFRASESILAAHPDVDALFIPIDTFASGAVRAGVQAGRTIGLDLLIATRYDGLRARTSSPPLTAVHLGLDEISGQAVDRLVTILDGSSHPSDAASEFAPTLVVRESTAGPAKQPAIGQGSA